MKRSCWVALGLGLLAAFVSCAKNIDEIELPLRDASTTGDGHSNGAPGHDSGMFGNPTNDGIRDASFGPSLDAFFINDPAPPICEADGKEQTPPEPGGTALCPDDKNREGCPCPKEGMQASCWPGRRLNRNHGVCEDGVTTCSETTEFGLLWGACEGYVLPQPDAIAGPEACRCFSRGQWTLSNIGPCILKRADGDTKPAYLYSSSGIGGDGKLICDTGGTDPPTTAGSWSTTRLNVDCAGQYELCYTIKAGDVNHVKPDDCVIMTTCVETWYPEAATDMRLDDLPAWRSDDSVSACVEKFIKGGGYGEMSVIGKSIECDAVDDGTGKPYVFNRTDYCSPSCQETPDRPECRACSTGGSGMFGN